MDGIKRLMTEPFERLWERVIQFLPNFLAALLILVAGFVLGAVLKRLFLKIFRLTGLDKFSERSGVLELMRKGGFGEPSLSALLSRVVSWLTVVVFAVISMMSLGLPAVSHLLERFLLYLPNIFVAALILLIGYLLGSFLGRAALIAAVNAGMRFSRLMGRGVKAVVLVLSVSMALEQLGIGKESVVIAFAIILGGVVLSLSIAFGLGGKDIAKDYMEKKLKGREAKDDINHL